MRGLPGQCSGGGADGEVYTATHPGCMRDRLACSDTVQAVSEQPGNIRFPDGMPRGVRKARSYASPWQQSWAPLWLQNEAA